MKKKFTSGRVLIASFLILIFCGMIPHKSDGQPYALVALLIVPFSLVMPVSLVLFIIKMVRLGIKRNDKKSNTQSTITTIATKNNDLKISQPSTSNSKGDLSNNEDDDHLSSDLPYDMKNGIALIWQGITKKASIKLYDETKRRNGVITRLTIHDDGEFYIDLTDEDTGEILTIKEKDITTQFVVGSTRYNFIDLCRKVFKLDLSEMFEYVNAVREEAKQPELITTFDPVVITFTYESKENGKTKRTVSVSKYYKNKLGGDYISGYCHLRKEERLFKANNIKSKIYTDDGKSYFFNEWLGTVYNSTETLKQSKEQSANNHTQQPATNNNDPFEQLERLASLKEKGIITEEEFQAQKAKILG